MSQSLATIIVHLVFATKDRRPFLRGELKCRTHRFMGGILRKMDCQPLSVGGVEDHVHVLFSLSKSVAIKDVVNRLKSSSSGWIKELGPELHQFQWQGGYGAFSVSSSLLDKARAYVDNQEEHHRKVTYQDELRSLLKLNGLEFDERYLWK